MIPVPSVGERFGRFVVTAVGLRKGVSRAVGVRCDCGNERVVEIAPLTRGRSGSCGCAKNRRPKSAPIASDALAGLRFGRLTITACVGRDEHRNRKVAASCDCGSAGVYFLSSVRFGSTLSCGCLHRELAAGTAREANTTHGLSASRLFSRWASMMDRCSNPASTEFRNYGARGIGVCARWRDAASFLADIGVPPTPNHTIDRIDNDGGYWCGDASCADCGPAGRVRNVRWATRSEQMRNTRRTTRVDLGGVRVAAIDIAEAHGIPPSTMHDRISSGWSPAAAATTPVNHRLNRLTATEST